MSLIMLNPNDPTFIEGQEAFCDGAKQDSNPYVFNTDFWHLWNYGWKDAQQEDKEFRNTHIDANEWN